VRVWEGVGKVSILALRNFWTFLNAARAGEWGEVVQGKLNVEMTV